MGSSVFSRWGDQYSVVGSSVFSRWGVQEDLKLMWKMNKRLLFIDGLKPKVQVILMDNFCLIKEDYSVYP